MKNFFNHSIGIVTLIVIAFFANIVSATNNAVNPPAGAPLGNTPFLINVGSLSQAKGDITTTNGLLGVGRLQVAQSAQVNGKSFFKSLIIGGNPTNPSAPEDGTTLAVGDAAHVGNVAADGSVFAENAGSGGLYSGKVIASVGTLQPVCGDTNGNIVFCPPPPLPVQKPKEHYAVAYNMASGQNIDPHTYSGQTTPNDIVSIDTRNVLINTLQPGAWTLTSLAHHVTPFAKPAVDSNEHIWTVAENGTYDLSFKADGVIKTYMVPRSKQQMVVNFYLKVNNMIIPLAAPKSGGCTTTTNDPITPLADSQFIIHWPCPGHLGSFGWRKHTEAVNYTVASNQTMTLHAGDQVSLYATGTGYGTRHNLSGTGDIYDEYFTFTINTAALDVIEH